MKLLMNFLLLSVFLTLFLQHKAEIAYYTAAQLKESLQMRDTIVAEEIARLQAIEPPISDANQELIKQLYALRWKLQLDIGNIDLYMHENPQQQEIMMPLARGSTSQISAASETPPLTENEAKTFAKWWSYFSRRKNLNQPMKSQSNPATFPYAIEAATTNYAPIQQQHQQQQYQTETAAAAPIILSPEQLSALGVGDQSYFFVAPPYLRDSPDTRPSFLNRIVSFFRPAADHNNQQNQLKIQPGQNAGEGAYSNLDGTSGADITAHDFLLKLIKHRNNLDYFIHKLQAERNE